MNFYRAFFYLAIRNKRVLRYYSSWSFPYGQKGLASYRKVITFKTKKHDFQRNQTKDMAGFAIDDMNEDLLLGGIVNTDVQDPLHELKITQLNSPLDNALMKSVLSCSSVNELHDVVTKNKTTLKTVHLLQAMSVIADLKDSGALEATHLSGNSSFLPFLKLIIDLCQDFSTEELVCTVWVIHKLGISLRDESIQSLLLVAKNKIIESDEISTLCLLTYFTPFGSYRTLWRLLFLWDFLPLIFHKFENISSAQDLKNLLQCLQYFQKALPDHFWGEFREVIIRCVDDGILNSETPQEVMECMRILPKRIYSEVQRTLCLILKKDIVHLIQLQTPSIKHVLEILNFIKQPFEVIKEINEFSKSLVHKDTKLEWDTILLLLVLQINVNQFTAHEFLETIQKYFEQGLQEDPSTIANSRVMVDIISLELCSHELRYKYWSKVLELVTAKDCGIPSMVLLGRRYIMDRLGSGRNCRRHFDFERYMTNAFKQLLINKAIYNSASFTGAASFIIMHGTPEDLKFVMYECDKRNCAYSIKNIYDLSRGFTLRLDSDWHSQSSEYLICKEELVNRINNWCWRMMNTRVSTFNEQALLQRSYIKKSTDDYASFFSQWVERWSKIKEPMSVDNFVKISESLLKYSLLVPEVIDLMCEYVINNESYLVPKAIGIFLTMLYFLNYLPKNGDKLLSSAVRVISGNREHIPAIHLILASLGLVYYQTLPLDLAKYVLNIDFLKSSYREADIWLTPLRVKEHRRQIMNLNRTACIEMPEADIPWFHKEYCQLNRTISGTLSPRFTSEVHRQLVATVGSENVRTNAYSSYGHTIDFQVVLDGQNKPICARSEDFNSTQFNRLAVQLSSEIYYTRGSRRIKGYKELEDRQLEILGYRVIRVDEKDWMLAEHNFLQRLIWPAKHKDLAHA